MQTQQIINFFGTVSNSATSRTSKTGSKYTVFGGLHHRFWLVTPPLQNYYLITYLDSVRQIATRVPRELPSSA